MYNVVVADTSCLIILEKINRLNLLKELFGSISITEIVNQEFGHGLPNWIKVQTVNNKDVQRSLSLALDLGEASAISLAMEQKALLIVDEKKGRKVARQMKVPIIGTIGILVLSYKKGLINSLPKELNDLKEHGFHISEKLVEQILLKGININDGRK